MPWIIVEKATNKVWEMQNPPNPGPNMRSNMEQNAIAYGFTLPQVDILDVTENEYQVRLAADTERVDHLAASDEVKSICEKRSNLLFNQARELMESEGIVFNHIPSPSKTPTERIDAAFPGTDMARVIFEALFELSNRIVALESGTPITRAQLKTWLINKLP